MLTQHKRTCSFHLSRLAPGVKAHASNFYGRPKLSHSNGSQCRSRSRTTGPMPAHQQMFPHLKPRINDKFSSIFRFYAFTTRATRALWKLYTSELLEFSSGCYFALCVCTPSRHLIYVQTNFHINKHIGTQRVRFSLDIFRFIRAHTCQRLALTSLFFSVFFFASLFLSILRLSLRCIQHDLSLLREIEKKVKKTASFGRTTKFEFRMESYSYPFSLSLSPVRLCCVLISHFHRRLSDRIRRRKNEIQISCTLTHI